MIRVMNPLMASTFTSRFPSMGQLTPLVPPAPPAGTGLVAAGAGLAALALGGVSVLFMYGVAKESKSSLVKTTGYVLAGVSVLAALVEAVTVGAVVYNSTKA